MFRAEKWGGGCILGELATRGFLLRGWGWGGTPPAGAGGSGGGLVEAAYQLNFQAEQKQNDNDSHFAH